MADWTIGGGYVYSDVVLRDKDGNPTMHEDVTIVELDMADGRVQPYCDVSAFKFYVIEPVPDMDNYYLVKNAAIPGIGGWVADNKGILGRIAQSTLEDDNYGYVQDWSGTPQRTIGFLFSPKALTFGAVYSYDDLVK